VRRVVLTVSICLLALAVASRASAFPSDPKTGVTILDTEKVYPGYVLFTPLLGDSSMGTEGVVYLINVRGEVVHTWTKDNAPGEYAQLLPNGHLMYAGQSEKDVDVPPGGGGLLEELDWDGNVVWSYENDFMHHDFEPLPNGNVASLVYAKIPPSLAEQVQGGLPGTELEDGSMWSDSIIEIDRDGEIVWAWNAWEHLDPAVDAIHPDINRQEWTHANSLRHLEANPITGSEAYLISFRQISLIALVDRESGDIIWKWGPGVLSHQHDARPLDNGNILVFDNGEDPRDTPTGHTMPRSRVVEVDPRQDGGTVVWEYEAGGIAPVPPERSILMWRFFSPIISGAQRLPNGNTMITEGVTGRLFEVTAEGDIVWEYVSPYGDLIDDGPSRETWIFKALKYSPEDIDFPESLPAPLERLSPEEVSADVTPEGVAQEGAPAVAPAVVRGGGGGDLAWWQGMVIGVGAAAGFFVVGFVAGRLVVRR
jgi:hypothetical protein